MVSAALCCSLSTGVKFAALISILMGVGMAAVSSWVLHKNLQARANPTLRTATDLIHQVNTFFGGTTGLYDLDVIYRILISCSATALASGSIQFLMGFWLFLSSERSGGGMAKVWVIIQIIIMLALGGAFLCIMTNELEIHLSLYVFLIVAGIDFLLMIYFTWLVFAFAVHGTDDGYRSRNIVYSLASDAPGHQAQHHQRNANTKPRLETTDV